MSPGASAELSKDREPHGVSPRAAGHASQPTHTNSLPSSWAIAEGEVSRMGEIEAWRHPQGSQSLPPLLEASVPSGCLLSGGKSPQDNSERALSSGQESQLS